LLYAARTAAGQAGLSFESSGGTPEQVASAFRESGVNPFGPAPLKETA
jgi:hypothetical protein